MKIDIRDFSGGISPVTAPQLLEQRQASVSNNTNLQSGELRCWIQELFSVRTGEYDLVQTMFLLEDSYWLTWNAPVSVASGIISSEDTGRIYYTGDGTPKKTDLSAATGGSQPYPSASYPLGVPKPTAGCTATLGGGGTGSVTTRNYVVTNVTGWGEESAPGPASNDVDAMSGQTVQLTAIPLGASGANITARRLYRAVTNSDGVAAYLFVTEIANNTAETYDDSKTDDECGSELNTSTWEPPPANLSGLISLPIQCLAGFSGKDMYMTPIGLPYAWPIQNILTLEHNIVGMAVQAANVVVATDQNPYVVTGYDPSSMSPVKLPDSQPCVSGRAVSGCALGVIYPTPEGLYIVNGTEGQLLTAKTFDVNTWKNFYPETAHAHIYNNNYFMFYNGGVGKRGCLVIDIKTGVVTTHSLYTSAAFVHRKTGSMYFIKDSPEVETPVLTGPSTADSNSEVEVQIVAFESFSSPTWAISFDGGTYSGPDDDGVVTLTTGEYTEEFVATLSVSVQEAGLEASDAALKQITISAV